MATLDRGCRPCPDGTHKSFNFLPEPIHTGNGSVGAAGSILFAFGTLGKPHFEPDPGVTSTLTFDRNMTGCG